MFSSCKISVIKLKNIRDIVKRKGGIFMTEQLIKQIKDIQHCLINKEMTGDEYEEKMQIVKKLEEVNTYLKDALSRGIEF